MREPGDDDGVLPDAAALADLRSRYRGSIDLDDVVRWRQDPQAIGSNGSRSPVARAGDLGPLIYGRAATPEAERRREAATAEAEALLAGWAADSAALDAALREQARGSGGEHPADVATPRRLARRRRAPRARAALLAAAAAVAVAVLVVVGVLLRPSAPSVDRVEPLTSTPTPLPTTARPTPTPKPTRTIPPPVVAVTPPPEDIDLRRDYYEDDIYSVLQVPINGGPIDNANGTATVDDYGVPLSYVVASGDVFELIAKRFDLGTTYLASINAVRRENPTELFVGDTINLGATTILRIGDQNGVVYNYTDRLPEPHLPQD